jgi:excisionase family DNA binding protein
MNENALTERKTLSIEEAAGALGIGRTLAYEAVRRGEIPTIRIGRRLLVPRGALDQLLGIAATVGADSLIQRIVERTDLETDESPLPTTTADWHESA